MTRWVVLASSRPEAEAASVDAWLAKVSELAGSPDVRDADAGRVLQGSVADADLTADVSISGDDRPLPAVPAVAEILGDHCLATVESLALQVVAAAGVHLTGPRIKRTLALTVREGTPEGDIERFERSLVAMPEHIREIRSWSLSRVDRARSDGRWTHVWEQEYADVDGVRVAYLQHPYHWTGVDRWFDPEFPEGMINPRICHTFVSIPASVLSA